MINANGPWECLQYYVGAIWAAGVRGSALKAQRLWCTPVLHVVLKTASILKKLMLLHVAIRFSSQWQMPMEPWTKRSADE